jgi:hypothetical protein
MIPHTSKDKCSNFQLGVRCIELRIGRHVDREPIRLQQTDVGLCKLISSASCGPSPTSSMSTVACTILLVVVQHIRLKPARAITDAQVPCLVWPEA